MSASRKKGSSASSVEQAQRLEIVRLHQQGKTPSEISKILGVSRPMVYRWRNASPKEISEDRGKHAGGRKPSLSPEEELLVVKEAHAYKQNHGGRLSITSLAKSLGLSYVVVRRILLKHEVPIRGGPSVSAGKENVNSEVEPSIPTQREVSRVCGYSQSVVSRALKNDRRVKSDTRKEIQQVAARLGYRLNPHLTSLSERRWKGQERYLKFAYLTEVTDGKFVGPKDRLLYQALSAESEMKGYTLEVHNPAEYASAARLLQVLYHRGIQGVIVGLQLRKGITDRLFQGVDWSSFSVMGCGNTNTSYLNSVSVQQMDSALRTGFEQGLKHRYRRIGYLYLPMSEQMVTVQPWNSPFILNLMEKLQAGFLAPHNRIPGLLLGDIDEDYELNTLRDYLQRYKPDLLLCNCDRGFALLNQLSKKKKSPVAFISLDKGGGETDGIAGLILSDWNDYASRLLDALSEQIRYHEFGLPSGPRSQGVTYKKWCEGVSLPRHILKKSKLEWHIQNLTTNLNSKAKRKPYRFLDMSSVVNSNRMVPGEWFGKATLPLPKEVLDDGVVRFQPIESSDAADKNVLMMRSLKNRDSHRQSLYPDRVTLPVNSKVKACHFLHAGGYVAEFETFASYSLLYKDGAREVYPLAALSPFHRTSSISPQLAWESEEEESQCSVPLHYKYAPTGNIGDWFAHYTLHPEQMVSNAKVVVVSDSAKLFYCYLFTLRWENPHPEKEVMSLEIQSFADKRSTLAVLGITLEEA